MNWYLALSMMRKQQRDTTKSQQYSCLKFKEPSIHYYTTECFYECEVKAGRYHSVAGYDPFLAQRRVVVRYKEGFTSEKVVEYGVPQRSPLSPLLFKLYISILFEDGALKCRFGYANDINVVRAG